MDHDAGETRARPGMQRPGDRHQRVGLRRNATPPLAAIDLDQHVEDDAEILAAGGNGLRRLQVIGDDGESHARLDQRRRLAELRRRDADGVEDVLEAVGGEVLGLLQGRDGDAAEMTIDRHAGDVHRLGRLQVRT